jgi:hypothetical protein
VNDRLEIVPRLGIAEDDRTQNLPIDRRQRRTFATLRHEHKRAKPVGNAAANFRFAENIVPHCVGIDYKRSAFRKQSSDLTLATADSPDQPDHRRRTVLIALGGARLSS